MDRSLKRQKTFLSIQIVQGKSGMQDLITHSLIRANLMVLLLVIASATVKNDHKIKGWPMRWEPKHTGNCPGGKDLKLCLLLCFQIATR